jgi:hypothetical protein
LEPAGIFDGQVRVPWQMCLALKGRVLSCSPGLLCAGVWASCELTLGFNGLGPLPCVSFLSGGLFCPQLRGLM